MAAGLIAFTLVALPAIGAVTAYMVATERVDSGQRVDDVDRHYLSTLVALPEIAPRPPVPAAVRPRFRNRFGGRRLWSTVEWSTTQR